TGQLRLFQDACDAFGLDTEPLQRAPGWPDKAVVDVPAWGGPTTLRAIVSVERSDGALRVDVLKGAQAIGVLAEHTYRRHYVAALGKPRRHLELISTIARRVDVFRVRGRGTIGEVATAIASHAPLAR